ncbi:MAG: polysaccharide deacetylase family protein [Phycisphaerae bacterium]
MRTRFILLTAPLVVCGCTPPGDLPTDRSPRVNLQITEDEDVGALKAFMEELDARGVRATLIVNEYVATEGCDQLQRYGQSGHEIMAYGRPVEAPGETVTLTVLSYEEQEEVIARACSAIEECLGHDVEGFRSYRFAHNDDTWQILDTLGIKYNLSFVAYSSNALEGHTEDVWPYPVPGHDFWAVPMHSAEYAGNTRAFCDMPFSSLPPADWEELMKSELLRMGEAGLPLKVEFHPYFSANDDGRWNAFLGFLDYAQEQGAEFITITQMMEAMSAAD